MRSQRLKRLMERLWRACLRHGDYGLELQLWERGLSVLERKYGVQIYLSGFTPSEMIEERPNVTLRIKPD